MLPDTGADVTVIGRRHLETLKISESSLHPPPSVTTVNADGSPMAPALGAFQATLSIGKQSCGANILVHSDVAMPLMSKKHCKELAIIPSEFPKPILNVKHVNRCTKLPFSATTTPSEAKAYFLQEFRDVLVSKEDLQTAPLKSMKGPPMKIHLRMQCLSPSTLHVKSPSLFKTRSRRNWTLW